MHKIQQAKYELFMAYQRATHVCDTFLINSVLYVWLWLLPREMQHLLFCCNYSVLENAVNPPSKLYNSAKPISCIAPQALAERPPDLQ